MTPIETLWEKLRQDTLIDPLRESDCRLLKTDLTSAFDIFAGVDSIGCAIVAFSTRAKPPEIDFETGALDYFRQPRLNGHWLMALRLKNENLQQVFGRLCQDLIDESRAILTEAGLISLFRERLTLWKRLFVQNNDGLLKPNQIKGLLGELLALESFSAALQDAPHSLILAWTGPDGGNQDFLFSNQAIEIKSIAPFTEEITISSPAQLDCALPLELHLYVLKESAPEQGGSLSLAMQVIRIENILRSSPEALKAFRQKLLAVGYVENPYYDTVTFIPMETKRYSVTEQFPKV
ncbi:PD-(D/E)XK motif protein [Herbaspirillum chlorophenolicum]|nr:PD-(D/E)XK motif protein [Herbaspirillum chlorophenolicum]